MRMRACVGGFATVVMFAFAGCAGGDDSAGSSGGGAGGPCTPGMDSTALVGTAMDPCPQDQCPDDPLVPGTTNDYITVATCPAAAAGGTSTWSQCQCKPKCGNGAKQAAEACDGADLGNMTCATMGKGMGMVTCTAQCTINATMCKAVTATGGAGG